MYWNSIVFTGKMLNSFNEHESFLLKSNSYKEYHRTAAPWHLLSEFRSRNVNCTMTLSSFRSWHVIPWSSGLLAGRRALRHCSYERTQNLPPSLHWLLQRASLEGLCSALLSLPQPQTEWCASFFQQQIPWSSPRCASPTAELPWLRSASSDPALFGSLTNLLLNMNQKLIVGERGFRAVLNQMLKKVCFGRTLIFYQVKDRAQWSAVSKPSHKGSSSFWRKCV